MLPSSPYPPFKTDTSFVYWAEKFQSKIQLRHWKRENRKWDFIINEFGKRGIRKNNMQFWYSYYNRTLKEMSYFKKAVQADIVKTCERLGESIMELHMRQADYDGCWERIAALMVMHSSRWTAARVKYAWTHGVSDLFPDLMLSL
ncbi:1ae957aa-9119-43aa-9101-68052a38fb91 [Sclerotinia trifoliorum]|uniref:1ae957aa-9119-43aa-9101-68052a38fb91 n=1 Tax=Sclerotinia trifoliorum TaxID=28548 RepID=A0A8H2ZQ05_9HELO|nr:1ae957aa-9119-43aa-9101-68052a38fb91 [Sclerotinia trifoliorum]